jgi:hypothetical protein
VPVRHRQPHRLLGQPQRRECGGHDRSLAADGRDEALAAGQVPERAGRGEVAFVGDPGPPAEVDAQVGAKRAGHVGLVRRREQLGDGPAARPQQLEVARHQPGEHVLGDARQRGAARAALRRRLARACVRQRAARRSDEHRGGGQRCGDRRRRLLPVHLARLHHREDRLRAQAHGRVAQRLAERLARRVGDDHHVLAALDPEAGPHHRLHRPLEVAHRREP